MFFLSLPFFLFCPRNRTRASRGARGLVRPSSFLFSYRLRPVFPCSGQAWVKQPDRGTSRLPEGASLNSPPDLLSLSLSALSLPAVGPRRKRGALLYLHRALRRRAVKARVDSERRTALLRLRGVDDIALPLGNDRSIAGDAVVVSSDRGVRATAVRVGIRLRRLLRLLALRLGLLVGSSGARRGARGGRCVCVGLRGPLLRR